MLLENMTWPEFDEAKKKIDTVIIPVGSVEAHGRHLPLGTDVFAPVEIARRVEKKLRKRGKDVIIAPPIWYGHSFVLDVYPGTINVSADAFKAYIAEILREFAREGFRKLLLLNGHGGNHSPLILAAEEVAGEFEVEIWLINWWIDFRKEILEVCSSQGHAGEDETSVILAIKPELVKMKEAKGERKTKRVRVIRKDIGFELFPEGVNDDPRGANRKKGEAILEKVSEGIVKLLVGEDGQSY